MYTLLDFKEEALAEYLNSALRRHGLDSYVFNTGVSPEGEAIYSIACLNASELGLARHLIYSSSHFLRDIHPETARELQEIRRQNRQLFLALVTSKPAILVSILAMAAAALGYLFDL
ncbi:hypothetical protein [Pseudomonas panipatensis]|jgi:hypothetical protein|uniref:hypothetical protein n=1 Tax=Pseudomonas panipatensis TaxID=428992 RepID=UPI0035B4BB4D